MTGDGFRPEKAAPSSMKRLWRSQSIGIEQNNVNTMVTTGGRRCLALIRINN